MSQITNMLNRAAAGAHGESKKRVAVMLTPTSSQELDRVANAHNLSRSEFLERLVRSGQLEELAASLANPAA